MQHFHYEFQPEPQSVYSTPNPSQVNTGTTATPLDAAEQRRLQETIEDYLDRVCHPLVDTLPYAARQELRQEIAQHLHALVQAYRESGYAPALAAEKALDKFGPPHLVAQKWNPVTNREGQFRRIERWLARQWQGIAATLVLCGAAGLLGLMLRHAGTLSRPLVSHSRPSVATATTSALSPRPLAVARMTDEQAWLSLRAAQEAAIYQARAELISAQTRLAESQVALQNAEVSAALARNVVNSTGS